MAKNYHVTPKGDDWQVKQPGSSRASGKFETQTDAVDAARGWARNSGGGEVTIHRPNGQIRDRDTVPPANDPFPPKG